MDFYRQFVSTTAHSLHSQFSSSLPPYKEFQRSRKTKKLLKIPINFRDCICLFGKRNKTSNIEKFWKSFL